MLSHLFTGRRMILYNNQYLFIDLFNIIPWGTQQKQIVGFLNYC